MVMKMILWTKEKPKTRPGRKGFSYYVFDDKANREYCNRIFASVDNAKNSYAQVVTNGDIPCEYVSNIYDVETNEIVQVCYYEKINKSGKEILQFKTLDRERKQRGENG